MTKSGWARPRKLSARVTDPKLDGGCLRCPHTAAA
jgi:hypothetical protein